MGSAFGGLGLEFQVSGFGFQISHLRFGVWGLGLGVSVFEFRASRIGFRVSHLGVGASGFGKVDVRLPGKGDSGSHGARPFCLNHLDD